MQEENAQKHIRPELYKTRKTPTKYIYFATKTGKEHQESTDGKIWEGEVDNVIDQLNRRQSDGADNITF